MKKTLCLVASLLSFSFGNMNLSFAEKKPEINCMEGVWELGNKKFYVVNCDTDGDGFSDKLRGYPVIYQRGEDTYGVLKNAFIYWSDDNKNKKFDNEEFLIDYELDGFNGNEKKYLAPESVNFIKLI